MNNREKYEYWSDIAKYDLDTAESMLQAGRYLYVVFMCQQSIEKLAKGIYVLYYGDEAPRTHNIWVILKVIMDIPMLSEVVQANEFKLKITEYKPFFADLAFYYISERYPSYKDKLSTSISKERAYEVFQKTQEVFEWITFLEKYSK